MSFFLPVFSEDHPGLAESQGGLDLLALPNRRVVWIHYFPSTMSSAGSTEESMLRCATCRQWIDSAVFSEMCLANGNYRGRQLTEFGRGVREGRRLQEILPEPVTGPAASQGDAVVSRRCLACRLWFEGDWCDWCWQPGDDETDGRRRLSDFGRGVREGNRRCRLAVLRELGSIVMACPIMRPAASQGVPRYRWSFDLMTRRGDLIAEVHDVNDVIEEFIQRMDEGVIPGVPRATSDLDGTWLTSYTLEWDGRLLDDSFFRFSDLGIAMFAELTVHLMVAHHDSLVTRPLPVPVAAPEQPEVTTLWGPP